MQCDKIAALKNKRNNEKAAQSLQELSSAAKNNTNIMPFVIDAVENYCTLGEIADVLRATFGEHK